MLFVVFVFACVFSLFVLLISVLVFVNRLCVVVVCVSFACCCLFLRVYM